jgi:hypothetical protein
MPRYFFNVQEGDELIEDSEGIDLPNVAAVEEECRRIIKSVLNEPGFRDELLPGRSIRIDDASGRTVLVVPFVESDERIESPLEGDEDWAAASSRRHEDRGRIAKGC